MGTRIEYSIYHRIEGNGHEFQCLAVVNGEVGMMFGAHTKAEAELRAEEWVNKNFDTPERRARIDNLAAKRVAAKKQKQKGAA